MITTNTAGKIKNTSGKSILMLASRAAWSARSRRFSRISAAWLCSTADTLTPSWLDCTSTATKVWSSGTLVRVARWRNACCRGTPTCISTTVRRSSRVSGLSQRSETRIMALSNDRPACTPMVRCPARWAAPAGSAAAFAGPLPSQKDGRM